MNTDNTKKELIDALNTVAQRHGYADWYQIDMTESEQFERNEFKASVLNEVAEEYAAQKTAGINDSYSALLFSFDKQREGLKKLKQICLSSTNDNISADSINEVINPLIEPDYNFESEYNKLEKQTASMAEELERMKAELENCLRGEYALRMQNDKIKSDNEITLRAWKSKTDDLSYAVDQIKQLQKRIETETNEKDQFFMFLEWMDWQTENSEDPIIMTDSGWFFESDEDGDQPLTRDDLWDTYIHHLKKSLNNYNNESNNNGREV